MTGFLHGERRFPTCGEVHPADPEVWCDRPPHPPEEDHHDSIRGRSWTYAGVGRPAGEGDDARLVEVPIPLAGSMSVYSDGSVSFTTTQRPPVVGERMLIAWEDPEGNDAGGPMKIVRVVEDGDGWYVRAEPATSIHPNAN